VEKVALDFANRFHVWLRLMAQTKSLRLDIPASEAAKLEEIQEQLKPVLQVTYVSKVAAISYLIRNANIPKSVHQQ
jgi:hypothetical protein